MNRPPVIQGRDGGGFGSMERFGELIEVGLVDELGVKVRQERRVIPIRCVRHESVRRLAGVGHRGFPNASVGTKGGGLLTAVGHSRPLSHGASLRDRAGCRWRTAWKVPPWGLYGHA